MNERRIFDIVIIGAGPAGYCAAIRAAQLGLSAAVVEKTATLGGACLNIGCIPSKALLDSSERFVSAQIGLFAHGIKAESVSFDLGLMMERKNRLVAKLTGNIKTLFQASGIAAMPGIASFLDSRHIHVVSSGGLDTVEARRAIIIATGSAPIALPEVPFDGTFVVDSAGALAFDRVPGRLAIIGGGAIGIELASIWARLGSRVTIIEHMSQLLPGWEGQAVRLLSRLLIKQGITIMTEASITKFQTLYDCPRLTVQNQGKNQTIVADRVLVAIGRRPYLEGLRLDKIALSVEPKTGRIPVNNQFMTACDGVYAIGDCIPGPMLAHKAFGEGAAVAELIAGKAGFVNYNTIPAIVYSSPEIASVGATGESLRERGVAFTSGTYSFRANGRALAMEKPDGFVKVIARGDTDEVLGVHIVGNNASELIAEAVTLMEFGGSSEDLGRTIHAHPTQSEALKEAALDVEKRAIHSLPIRKKGISPGEPVRFDSTSTIPGDRSNERLN